MHAKALRFGQEKRGTRSQSPHKEMGDMDQTVKRGPKRLFLLPSTPAPPKAAQDVNLHTYAKLSQHTPEQVEYKAATAIQQEHSYTNFQECVERAPVTTAQSILTKHGFGNINHKYRECIEEIETSCHHLCTTSSPSVLRSREISNLRTKDVPLMILKEMDER